MKGEELQKVVQYKEDDVRDADDDGVNEYDTDDDENDEDNDGDGDIVMTMILYELTL